MINKAIRKYSFIVLIALISTVRASEVTQKTISLFVEIENEKFFTYAIETFEFDQPSLEVEFDKRNGRLIDAETNIVITTNVPSYFQSGYKVSPKKLTSICEGNRGDTIQDNFAEYFIDDKKLVVGEGVYFDDFSRERDTLWIKKPFYIDFSQLNDPLPSASYCKGTAVLLVELDF